MRAAARAAEKARLIFHGGAGRTEPAEGFRRAARYGSAVLVHAFLHVDDGPRLVRVDRRGFDGFAGRFGLDHGKP